MNRILIVAPDADFRKSLQFALESEGYRVVSQPGLGREGQRSDVDVTVVDHHALGEDRAQAIAYLEAHRPVVLLANAKAHDLSAWAFRTVMKPMLGPNLSGAVREALDLRAPAT